MNIKRKIAMVVTLAMLSSAFTTGCSFAGMSDSDLLRPPKATGTEAAIQTLLEKTTSGDYKLSYPQSGDYRSGIIMQDINGDRSNEAIALYKTTKDSANINIMFMKETGGKWESIASYKNANSNVDRLYFGDVDADGQNEVIVGWSSYLTGNNQIIMYDYNANNTISEVLVNSDTMYIDMALMDITNDGVQDLVVLTTAFNEKTSQTTTTARLYSCCIEGDFSRVSEIKTNPNIISYSQILQGNISNNVKGLFMDGNTSNANELITEVLYYSREKQILVNPLDYTETDGDVENITVRKTSTVCKDIDGDNIIEVPSPYIPVVDTNDITPCPIIKWYKIVSADGTIQETQQTVASYSDGFYFVLPNSWKGKIVASNDNTTRTTSFYEIIEEVDTNEISTEPATEKGTEKATVPEISTEPSEPVEYTGEKVSKISAEPVLELKVYSEKNWKNESATRLSEGYIVIKEESGFVYTCKLGNAVNSEINLSTDQVKNNFNFIK
ncbi:MAG: VCBS repeat-containing protein [Acutalibacteraceae bacterium]|nr:VCBS repeat-containing protein [Acutalibacteraceae bacterium]